MGGLFEKNCKIGGRYPHVSPHYGKPCKGHFLRTISHIRAHTFVEVHLFLMFQIVPQAARFSRDGDCVCGGT